MISTSAIRISCVVAEPDIERATQELHAAFDLDLPR
jgi:aspartokinase